MAKRTIAHVALLVRDYDEAIDYYTRILGFRLVEDVALSPERRWVLVAPRGATETTLLLARADGPEQIAHIGEQTGGRVFLFLETDDFKRDHSEFLERGVEFLEAPRHESYGVVAVFRDLYGNRWDLIERR